MIFVLAIAIILTVAPFVPVSSQNDMTSPASFSQALVQVQKAELAGATPQEILGLVNLLNKAVELDREANQLSAANETAKASQVTSQVNQTLITVESEAMQLTVSSTRRSSANKITLYLEGALAAVLGTFTYSFAVYINVRRKVKQTFQMRVKRK
jgi:hypothetical protein